MATRRLTHSQARQVWRVADSPLPPCTQLLAVTSRWMACPSQAGGHGLASHRRGRMAWQLRG
eukprot:6264072-Lingulodinium_polyedra.AAC.1